MENFFSFYEIDDKFFIDESLLREKYLAISKANHPDFFINNEEKYEQALETTSSNNKAYKTLNDFHLRAKHMLELHGGLDESKNAIPQAFLMEMMDLNETIMDLKMDYDLTKAEALVSEINQLNASLTETFEEQCKKADTEELHSAKWQEVADKIKDIYLKRKYVLRLLESVNTFAAE